MMKRMEGWGESVRERDKGYITIAEIRYTEQQSPDRLFVIAAEVGAFC